MNAKKITIIKMNCFKEKKFSVIPALNLPPQFTPALLSIINLPLIIFLPF